MDIGTLLVLFGLILAVIDLFVGASYQTGPVRGTLLHVAVILLGIGVLVLAGGLESDAALGVPGLVG